MARRKGETRPPISAIWKETRNGFYTADSAEIQKAIDRTGRNDEDLKRLVGAAWDDLDGLRKGAHEVGYWTCVHLEYALKSP